MTEKKKPNRKRDKRITIRGTAEEKAKIEQKAKKAGLSRNDYMLKVALSDKKINVIEGDHLHDLMVQIKKVGVNVWQIRKEILDNHSFTDKEKESFTNELEELDAQYQEIQNQLQKIIKKLN